MYYPIKVSKVDDGSFLVTSRDIPECVFNAPSEDEACAKATEMIPGCLELFYRRKRKAIPLPSAIQSGEIPIYGPLKFQAKILLWNHLVSHGYKLADVARKLNISQTQVQRLVDLSKDRASFEAIEDTLVAYGAQFTLTVEETLK